MRKVFLAISIFCLVLGVQSSFGQSLKQLRRSYFKAAKKEHICQSLIGDLQQNSGKSNVQLAYLGALETIWAKYVFNPFSKYSTFKKGKMKLERAVRKEPNNLEIRYLRLSIQKNVPHFLGYNKKIKEDIRYLKNNIEEVSSIQLRKMILSLINNQNETSTS